MQTESLAPAKDAGGMGSAIRLVSWTVFLLIALSLVGFSVSEIKDSIGGAPTVLKSLPAAVVLLIGSIGLTVEFVLGLVFVFTKR